MTALDAITPARPPLAAETVALVERWLAEAAEIAPDKAALRLAGLLKDPAGLPFTVGFVDGVVRPDDVRVAAHRLRELARDVPAFLPWHLRAAVRLGAVTSAVAPWLVVPLARRALRQMVAHLVVDARPKPLGRAIARIRGGGARLNVNLLGEAVLGQHEADRRLEGTRQLLERDDVDYVSIKVSSTVAPHPAWAFDEAVDHVVDRLRPLFELAAAAPVPKFINLDMEEYHDLDLTMAVFMTLLDEPALRGLEAGIVLQTYLPDALGAMIRLQDWAAERRAAGGAAVKVRVVKGANLPMEQVGAQVHGWPLATWDTKLDSDVNYKRVLSWAMHPERIANVRLGVAGHNLFDVAHAWLLAGERGVRDGVEIEMLLGMAQGQAEVVRREVGGLLLYTPVVKPAEFDVAIAYLVRRLEEGASADNFMSAVFDLHDDPRLLARERDRFLASLERVDDVVPAPRRTQDRRVPAAEVPAAFDNTPDSDPSLPGNRVWARELLARVPGSTLGVDLVERHTVRHAAALEDVLASAHAAGVAWGARSGAERADVLLAAARVLEDRRGELIEVMASEAGKTLEQADPEVSEAIDFVRYYSERARELDDVDGAEHVPVALTVVTPPWNFPVAIPCGSMVAALAAGSAVVAKPAPQAARCGSVVVQALWDAGVPADLLQLAHVEEGELGQALVADPRVDRVILTGAYATAELFRSFRPDLPLLAETSGKNAIVVTPSADLDLAVKDVVASAFGHAGQKCSAASLVILVGGVARSRRFRAQLVDAVSSLKVGLPSDPTATVGPLIEPASGKLLEALTTLRDGERWLVEPRRLDEEGRLWTPGVLEGVQPGSTTHRVEFFGPVLGIMTAETLEEALAIQNGVDYGLTAGLHSLDPAEIGQWLEGVQAGNLYVNRGITGAIVRRQPFGGWKKSAVGTGTKAGGPHYLVGLSDWRSRPSTVTAAPKGVASRLVDAAVADGLPADVVARLQRSFASDAAAWDSLLGVPVDPSGLTVERNVLRHVPVPVAVRAGAGASGADVVRVVGAGLVAGSAVQVSVADPLPEHVTAALADGGVEVAVEPLDAWRQRLARWDGPSRLRVLGDERGVVEAATGGRPDLAVHAGPVTEAGRVELLPFVHEQAISITAHRFGTPDHLTDALL